ncbi:MAG TPA: type II CAAX endopeptidase family protein [Candidatus Acidoferrum sp.]|nr:type II CAAX endopeptidase family protein [Candidatus Acidoferrum sp.]
MRFDRCALVFKLMRSGLEEENPYWSYEDIGVFSLVLAALGPILHLFTRFHLLSRSELENPGLGLQFALIVSLILALYLVLKLRHRRPVLRPLGWVWPCTAYVIVAPLLGVLLAAGVSIYLRLRGQSTPTMPLVEIVILGLVLGPILEESFFRGCLLPVLAHTVGKSFAVVLTALLFALFHSPANLAHWASFTGTGVAYGWIRVTSRSTTAPALAHAAYNLALLLLARF